MHFCESLARLKFLFSSNFIKHTFISYIIPYINICIIYTAYYTKEHEFWHESSIFNNILKYGVTL